MADGNATTVGSIVGKLKIDSSDWNRELAAAETKARQLGRANPTVKVSTNGAKQAVTELTAVEAAEKKVSASSEALARMREQGRLAAIARANAEKASVKPVMDYTQWTRRSTEATRDDTVAKNENAESNKRVDNTSRQAGRSIHLLYAGIAMLAPAISPLAAFAVAGAGALGIMGVSGVLAVKGISDQLKNGGPLANEFGEGLNTLREQAEALGQSSAVGMLEGYNRSIATLDAYMPGLTQQTGEYSRALGNLGSNTLAGVLGSLRTLDPVFQMFTGYLGDMTGKLAGIGSSNGLQRFGNYALATMPLVVSTLDSLIRGLSNLLVALSPLGNVALTSLKVFGDILTVIPHEVLTLLTGGALGAYAAFSTWSSLIPLIQSFGVMLNMSLGPVGLIVAGVGAIAGVMIGAAAATKDNTAATMGYTAALQRDNGIIAENVRAHTAQEIAKSKAGVGAQKLGLSLELLTKAATGDTIAQERLGNELDRLDRKSRDSANTTASMGGVNVEAMKSNHGLQAAIKDVREELTNQSGALQSSIDYQKRFDEAMGSTNASAGAQSSELSVLAAMYGTSVTNIRGAEEAERATADQLAKTTLQMQLQNDAGGLLKMQLDLLSGKSLSFEQAQNGFEKQLQSSTAAMQANGTAIDGNSEAAVNNRGSILGMVQSAQASAEAYGTMTGKSEDARAKLVELREKIIENMVANGGNRDAVERYVDSVMKIPAVKPTKIELDAAKAVADAAYLKWIIDNTNSKSVFLHAETSVSGPLNADTLKPGQVGRYQDGGMVNYLAGGGYPQFTPRGTDTVPAMLTPGEIVMKKSSVDSIGAGTLLEANETGRLPGGTTTVNLVLDGQIIDTRIVNHLGEVSRQVGGMRR